MMIATSIHDFSSCGGEKQDTLFCRNKMFWNEVLFLYFSAYQVAKG